MVISTAAKFNDLPDSYCKSIIEVVYGPKACPTEDTLARFVGMKWESVLALSLE